MGNHKAIILNCSCAGHRFRRATVANAIEILDGVNAGQVMEIKMRENNPPLIDGLLINKHVQNEQPLWMRNQREAWKGRSR